MKASIIIISSFLFISCGSTTTTLPGTPAALLPSDGEKGKIFEFYNAKDTSYWNKNWTYAVNLTGVSWNNEATCTLIAPQYVIMAGHFIRGQSIPVMFHDRSGKPYERYLASVKKIDGADIAVGKLNLPLPSDIKTYRLASSVNVGETVFTTDQTKTLSVHEVAAVNGATISLKFSNQVKASNRRNMISGDSGHPTFIIRNGDVELLETHTSGGPGSGPNYADPRIQAAVRAAMQ